MTTLELSLLSTELASARTNATLGASHVDQVRRTASITTNAGINIRPLHLAIYHFQEAAKLIDQALGKEAAPAAPTIADYIAAARNQVGIVAPRDPSPQNVGSTDPVAPSAQEPAEQPTLSPSPAAEKENMGSDSADAGAGEQLSVEANHQ